jgi:eukaryotic-like serine/threonine-protein kinase
MQAGDRIGQFELLEVIGRGGMGEVWRAHDTRLERDVALKTLSEQFAADPASIVRIEREARLLATLNHPNIAGILGLEQQDGQYWLVLELIEGLTLAEHLGSKGLGLRAATSIALQVAEALEAAHSRGIIHCDLKPSNIKISTAGRVKVLDFGIARIPQPRADDQQLTRTVQPVADEHAGTPAYMSPEQTRGEDIAPTSDIWAFGVLLYRMLAGRLPFAGATIADTAAQILQSEPDLSLLRPTAPAALIRLVRRCLEKEPRRRIQHAGDLRFLIEEALSAAPLPADPNTRRRRWRPIAIACIAMLIAGGLLWQFRREWSWAPATTNPGANTSIAVLPFMNMSADPEQQYFSDGLSEELINQLAHIEGLRVTARTSAFAFRERAQDVREVGLALGVAHILEGSVRKSGDRIRITAQLVNTATGYHVWSETFDRAADDVFAIQDEIAGAVASKLGPTLGVAPRATDYGGTRSPEAYDHLLRGHAEFAKQTPQGFQAAKEQYRQALAIDPDYARAYAELVITMGVGGIAAGDTATQRERAEAVRKALELAPDAPLTQVASMWIHSDRHEWLAADAACAKVFAARSDPRGEGICGGFLTLTGRVRAALPYREAFRSSDPLSLAAALSLARHYALLGMGQEMRMEFSRIDALYDAPSGGRGIGNESLLAYMAHAHVPQQELDAQLIRSCPTLLTTRCTAWATAIRDPQHAAALLRSQLRSVSADEAISIAMAAAYAGDAPLALDALETFTAGAGSAALQDLWYPVLSEVRRDPRFKRIVSGLGMVDLWQRTGRWADACHPTVAGDFECN